MPLPLHVSNCDSVCLTGIKDIVHAIGKTSLIILNTLFLSDPSHRSSTPFPIQSQSEPPPTHSSKFNVVYAGRGFTIMPIDN